MILNSKIKPRETPDMHLQPPAAVFVEEWHYFFLVAVKVSHPKTKDTRHALIMNLGLKRTSKPY